MKLLMLGWEFPPFSSGGLGTHCYGLTKSLKAKDVDITFIMPGGSDCVESQGIKIVQTGNGRIIKLPVALKPYIASLRVSSKVSVSGTSKEVYGHDFFKSVEQYNELAFQAGCEEDFDVIHCHDWMTFQAGVKLREKKKKPLVVTIHSTEHDRTGGHSVNTQITHMEWYGMYHADKVITVSNYMKRQIMERFSVPENKIEVVYNAVNSEEFLPMFIENSMGKKLVLFLGRMTIQKGPDYFLEAAKLVLDREKDVNFVMVGKGDMLHQMIEKAVHLGISNNVFFTGYVDDIRSIYNMADAYVMPSVSEPFGIVALEAMSAGTPVIVSKQSGVSEVTRHRFAVDFWDVRELADKILGILRYSPLKDEMSRNGLTEANSMTWDRTADQTLNVYKEAIKYPIQVR
jgi:glycosyltransferase involved in cell wall biosynthesis